MSNIGGIWYLDGRLVSDSALEGMRDALAWHRPRYVGFWREGPIAFIGCTEPFTPEEMHEQQPLLVPEKEPVFVLVSFARLDNRDELCTTLGVPTAERPQIPDSRLIFLAYKRWGEHCVTHLVGAFSFAIWDVHSRRLLCARDHLGFYPFYYYHQPGHCFAFATDARALHTLPEVPRELDELSLAHLLVKNAKYRPGATLYAQVHQLPNAHTFTVSPEALHLRRYWSFDPAWRIRYRTNEEYHEAFRDVFSTAVRAALRSVKTAGTQLSGGLDSSSVTGVTATILRERGETLPAFAMVPPAGFEGPREFSHKTHNDRAYIEDVARLHPNVALHYVTTADRPWLSGLDRLIAWGTPAFGSPNRSWWEAIAERAAAQGVNVILTGEQGNITISDWGNTYLAELLRQGRLFRMLREARALSRARDTSLARILASRVVRPLLRPVTFKWPDFDRIATQTPIAPAFFEASGLKARMLDGTAPEFERRFQMLDVKRKRMVEDPQEYPARFDWGYRYGLGVEYRDPTADKRVVEFCLSLPIAQFASGGRDRILVRDGLAGVLPPSVRYRTDRSDQSPDWYVRLAGARNDLSDLLNACQTSDMARRVLDLSRMRCLLDGFSVDPPPQSRIPYVQVLLKGAEIGAFLVHFERNAVTRPASSA